LKNENYKLVEELFYSSYFIEDRYETVKEPKRFDCFYNHIEIFDTYYRQTYSQNFYSPMADFIIKRLPSELNKDILVEADLLCNYIARLYKLRWFPITYIYKTEGRFELFDRMVSQRHFEKVKVLFNVNTFQEFKDLIANFKTTDKDAYSIRYSNAFDSVMPIYERIDIDRIGITR
jgi:hypothetical protein